MPVPGIAKAWLATRFRSPYLRNALWAAGYGADTLETAGDWSRVPALLAGLEASIAGALAGRGERVHVITHLSHAYPSGSSLYLTFLFRLADDPDESLDRWAAIKRAASDTIVAEGGTISHHHGVGADHAPYLAAEKGELGMAALAVGRADVRPGRADEPRGRCSRRRPTDERRPDPRARRRHPERPGDGLRPGRARSWRERAGPDRAVRPGRRPAAASRTPDLYWRALGEACRRLWAHARAAGATRSPAWRSRPSAARS